jgi:hypothetical protein
LDEVCGEEVEEVKIVLLNLLLPDPRKQGRFMQKPEPSVVCASGWKADDTDLGVDPEFLQKSLVQGGRIDGNIRMVLPAFQALQKIYLRAPIVF